MTRTLRDVANQADDNKLRPIFQKLNLGDLLGRIPRNLGHVTPSSHIVVLPENARCAAVLDGYLVAGSATGEAIPVTGAPANTLEVGVTPEGNILFLAADAVTSAEVTYLPLEGKVYEEYLDVASNAASPLGSKKASLLLEAEALAGSGTLGALTVMARKDNVGTQGEAALTAGGTFVFNSTDAWSRVRVKYVAVPGVGTAPDPVSTLIEEEQTAL